MSEQNQGEATLRELAIRLLSPRYPGAESMQVTDLLPGQLPPNPPIELAIPPDARLIGSIIRGQDSTTIFDTDLTAEELLAFYRERMAAIGWTEQEQFPSPQEQSGFVHAMPHQMAHAIFFATSHGPLLRLTAMPGPANMIEAQLALEMNPSRQGYGPLRRQLTAEMELLPPLLAPDGAQQRTLGGGGGGGEWRASADVTTNSISRRSLRITQCNSKALAGARFHTARATACAGASGTSPIKTASRGAPICSSSSNPTIRSATFLDIHCQWAGSSTSGGGGWLSYSS